jgi:hypothetical protein
MMDGWMDHGSFSSFDAKKIQNDSKQHGEALLELYLMMHTSTALHSRYHTQRIGKIKELCNKLVLHLLPQSISPAQQLHAINFAQENLNPSNAHYYAISSTSPVAASVAAIKDWIERFFIQNQEKTADQLQSLLDEFTQNIQRRNKDHAESSRNAAKHVDEENFYSILLVLTSLANNNQANQFTSQCISPFKGNSQRDKLEQSLADDEASDAIANSEDEWATEFSRNNASDSDNFSEDEEKSALHSSSSKQFLHPPENDENSFQEDEYELDLTKSHAHDADPLDFAVIPVVELPQLRTINESQLVFEILQWFIVDPRAETHSQASFQLNSLEITGFSPLTLQSSIAPFLEYLQNKGKIAQIMENYEFPLENQANNSSTLCFEALLHELSAVLYAQRLYSIELQQKPMVSTLLHLQNAVKPLFSALSAVVELCERLNLLENNAIPHSSQLISTLFEACSTEFMFSPLETPELSGANHSTLFSLFYAVLLPFLDTLDAQFSLSYCFQRSENPSPAQSSLLLPNFLIFLQGQLEITQNQANLLYKILISRQKSVNLNDFGPEKLQFQSFRAEFLAVAAQFSIIHDCSGGIQPISVISTGFHDENTANSLNFCFSTAIPAVKSGERVVSAVQGTNCPINAVNFTELLGKGLILPLQRRKTQINALLKQQLLWGFLKPLKIAEIALFSRCSGLFSVFSALKAVFFMWDSVVWAEISRRIQGLSHFSAILAGEIIRDALEGEENQGKLGKFAVNQLNLAVREQKSVGSAENRLKLFDLYLELPWPYNFVVNSAHLAVYNQTFQFLTLIQRSILSLNSIQLNSKQVPVNSSGLGPKHRRGGTNFNSSGAFSANCSQDLGENGPNLAILAASGEHHGFFLLRYEMLHLLIQLRNYCYQILDKNWANFMEKLENLAQNEASPCNLEIIRELHSNSVAVIAMELLLSPAFRPAFQAVEGAIGATLQLGALELTGESVATLRVKFRQQVGFLLMLLRSVSDRAGAEQVNLTLLAQAVDFNGYYASRAT